MPRFRQIEPVHVEPAIEVLIEQQLSSLTELELRLDRLGADVTPADVLVPLEEISAPLSFAWGLVNHLMAVKNSDELRAAQAKMQPKVVELGSRFAQSLPLYHALKFLETDGESLDQGERRAVEAGVKDAEQGGVALEGAAKDRFNAIKQRLAELSTTFSNNVLDATKAYELVVADKTELEGLPPSTLALAAQNAGGGATAEAGPWKLTLDVRRQPSTPHIMLASWLDSECSRGTHCGMRGAFADAHHAACDAVRPLDRAAGDVRWRQHRAHLHHSCSSAC
eukprot:SAG11_NODE_18_length_25850_cov_18.210050_8_plen_281_part_00